MHDPDVVLRVDAEPDRLTDTPVVRERLGEHRVHFEARRHDRALSLHSNRAIEHATTHTERNDRRHKARANHKVSWSAHLVFSPAAPSPLNTNFWSRFPSYVSPV